MTSDLDPKLAKALRGECAYSGCHEQAVDGEHCAPHAAHEAARRRQRDKRQRQARADAGLCIVAGCDTQISKRRRPDGTVMMRRCKGCGKTHRDAARARRGASGDPRGASGDPSDDVSISTRNVVKFEPGKRDGLLVRRVTTDRGRGAPSREDRQAEVVRDFRLAKAELEKGARAYSIAIGPEVASLPAIQRDAAMREARGMVEYAARFLDDLAERIK